MGLLQRIRNLLKSNLNEAVSRLEDPEKVLGQAIEDMSKQVREARQKVAASIADEKKLSRQLEKQRQNAQDWEKKAMAAVRAGRDDLAVEALERKKTFEAAALQLEGQLEGQAEAVAILKKALSALNAKIEDAKRKQAVLLARAKHAEAQRAIADTLTMANDKSATDHFDRMAEKIEKLEADAEARMEIAAVSEASAMDPLSEEIRRLEARSSSDDLADLKKKMALLESGEAPKALSAGADSDSADTEDARADSPPEQGVEDGVIERQES